MQADLQRTKTLLSKLQRLPGQIEDNPQPEAVHRLRTSIRRLETIISATWQTPGRKEHRLLKQLRRIRRRAGKVRDLDVQITALESVRLESAGRDKARVLRCLEDARAKREKKLVDGFKKELENGLQKRLKRTAARVQEASAASGESEGAAKSGHFLASALQKFAEVVRKYPALTESNLHNFRMECKRVRYLAEMAGKTREAAAMLGQLRRVQNAIGDWHDWLTLTGTAESVLGSGQSSLLPALRASTRSRFLEAERVSADARRILLGMQEGARKPVARASPAPGAEVHAAGA